MLNNVSGGNGTNTQGTFVLKCPMYTEALGVRHPRLVAIARHLKNTNKQGRRAQSAVPVAPLDTRQDSVCPLVIKANNVIVDISDDEPQE
jgi:hypothetical protein